ncbi:MAG: GNAT family N-acetyltransferase [Deltaproteobacteria bacterium]|nr:GNAT family N-acetyltransferase [Deltaproteobacteria bacterium]
MSTIVDHPLARPHAALPGPVTLTGRLVRLVPLDESHLDGLLAAAQHPTETYPFTWVPRTEAALRKWFNEALAGLRAGTFIPFVTFDHQENRVVGSTRFGNLERWEWAQGAMRPAGSIDAVEIGWTWLAAHAMRSGINTEAKLLMLTHAFETLQVHRVTLKTDARNFRSRNAIERIGGKLDGIFRAQTAASDGGIRDSAMFSLLASEWPENKQRLSALLR